MKKQENHKIIDYYPCLYLGIFVFSTLISSCMWAAHHERTIISENGIHNLIELGQTIDEFSKNEIAYTIKKAPFRHPDQKHYCIKDLGIEFETLNDIIVRVWFYAGKNNKFKIIMPKDRSLREISSITTADIINSFGDVKKYEGQNAPKGIQKAVWLKYKPFGVAVNTINYPDSSFHFGFNWDDTLSYITVSK